jgi:hypothetical protein
VSDQAADVAKQRGAAFDCRAVVSGWKYCSFSGAGGKAILSDR